MIKDWSRRKKVFAHLLFLMGGVFLWRLTHPNAGPPQHILKTGAYALAFSPSGKVFATGGEKVITLWDTTTWKRLHTLKRHTAAVMILAFSGDSKLLATWSDPYHGLDRKSIKADFIINLWDVRTGTLKRQLQGPYDESVQAAAFSPDGALLATGYEKIRLWDVATGKQEKVIPQKELLQALAFSPDGKILASNAGLGVSLWDVRTGQQMMELTGIMAGVRALAFQSKVLMAIDSSGAVYRWNIPSGDLIDRMNREDYSSSMNLVPNGRYFVWSATHGDWTWHGSSTTVIKVQNTQSGKVLWGTSVKDEYLPVALSPDARQVAVSRFDDETMTASVWVWDVS